MKKLNVLLCIALFLSVYDASAFGRRNHAAIAYIAEQNLTPKARRAVREIFRGESLAEYAVAPDVHRMDIRVKLEPEEYMMVDGRPVLKGPDGKPFCYGTAFFTAEDGSVWTTVAHGWYADSSFNVVSVPKGECVWAIRHYAEKLRSWRTLDQEERHLALQMVVHEVGDLMCPSHVHFTDRRDRDDLKYSVVYRNRTIRYHNIWDTDILVDSYPGGMIDMAYYADPLLNGSLEKKEAERQKREIQKGTLEDWAKDTASRLAPVFEVNPGDTVTFSQIDEFTVLGREMIRRAGYRAAALLNDIFR